MRLRTLIAVVAVTALHVAPAAAQSGGAGAPAGAADVQAAGADVQPETTVGSMAGTGEVDTGFRVTSLPDDIGRYLWFSDPRGGVMLDRLRYTLARDTWTLRAAVDNAGYRNQRYAAWYERAGTVKASFEWNQLPVWFSGVSAAPFSAPARAVFRLNDAAQTAVQDGASVESAFASELRGFDTRARRDVAEARLVYSAAQSVDVSAFFRSTARRGDIPWSASFSLSNAIEVAGPMDARTNDAGAAVEWSSRRGTLRLAYDTSFFASRASDTDLLVWDNPLRITDEVNGPSQGRMPLWPDSQAHTVSATGSIRLPARTVGVAALSVGSWLQDAPLLPHTINTAIEPIPLARGTAEAEARIVSMVYRVTSRPTSALWLSGQYRLYDYDNRTPHFPVDQYVKLDSSVGTSATGGSEAFSMARHLVDLDASYTPFRFVAVRAGYGREAADRSYRVFETTVENTVRASIDSTSFAWGSLRLQYDHSVRTGDGLDEQVLGDIGEQISLRQFDISDRTRDRVSAVVQVMPSDMLGVNASVAIGRDRRPRAAFGLQENDLTSFGVGVDLTPHAAVSAAVSYGFERLSTLQRSRQASPGPEFDDPTRDWETDLAEHVHTWTASIDLPRVTERTAVRGSYDFVRSHAQYLYVLPPDSSLAPPEQLPALVNGIHRASADFDYAFTGRMALRLGYRLDTWAVSDFGRSAEALDTPLIPGFVNVLYRWVPYTIQTGIVALRYRW